MSYLFSPLKIKNLELANRVVCPPMANNAADANGHVTEKLINHYVAKAAAGLILVEHSYVNGDGRMQTNQLGIHDDNCIPGLSRLAQAIHDAGGKCGIQLTHGGSSCPDAILGHQPVAPSAVTHPKDGIEPREITIAEIKDLPKYFAMAAGRAKQAGFDLVEIHSAHGYLLNQFLSPFTNKRTDDYGGPLQNRARLVLEIVQAVRAAVGPDYPIFIRLACDDSLEGGITPELGAEAAVLLAEAGVDVLDVSGGLMGSRVRSGEGFNIYLAEKVKPLVNIPVLVTGGITLPETAERIVAEGKADLTGIGRAFLANSNWSVEAKAKLA